MLGIDVMRQHVGLQEVRDNKQIKAFLKSQSINGDIAIDPAQTPWCSAIMNACERYVGHITLGKLNARSWLTYGEHVELKDAKEGDIVIFDFGHDGVHGHVSYFEFDNDAYNLVTCLGGNQHNCVNDSNYISNYIVDIRRAP